MGTQVM